MIAGETLMRQPYYTNLKLLRRHRIRSVSVAHYEQVRVLAKQTTTLTWSEVKEGKYGKDGRGILSSLVISGHLKLEPCAFTTARSVISLLGTKSMVER
jgi:hypothetical protein